MRTQAPLSSEVRVWKQIQNGRDGAKFENTFWKGGGSLCAEREPYWFGGVLAFLQDPVWLPWLGARSLRVVAERGKSGRVKTEPNSQPDLKQRYRQQSSYTCACAHIHTHTLREAHVKVKGEVREIHLLAQGTSVNASKPLRAGESSGWSRGSQS